MTITTRTPAQPEAAGGIEVYHQAHEDYGIKRSFNNDQESAYVANRWRRPHAHA